MVDTSPLLKIAQWREYRGYTQDQLAERAGVSKPMISHIENGKRRASQQMQEKLAAALDVSIDLLFREPGDTAEIYSIADQLDPMRRSALLATARSLRENASEYKAG
jgi:transcriptional regulator with XRE-family HTH domain